MSEEKEKLDFELDEFGAESIEDMDWQESIYQRYLENELDSYLWG